MPNVMILFVLSMMINLLYCTKNLFKQSLGSLEFKFKSLRRFYSIVCELSEYFTRNAQGLNYRLTFCVVNSCYCNYKVVNHTKIAKQLFPKETLIRPNYIFSYYILIFFILCILLSKEILLITEITPQNVKKMLLYLAILKKHFSMCEGENLATLDIFITK